MKIAYKEQSENHQNSTVCLAIEYPLGDKDINGAVIKLKGRYPDKGWAMNLKCKEVAYVMNGSGRVVVEGREIRLKQGDMILIEPKEKYFWDGEMELFMPCTPAWYPGQYKELE
jgi:mannose-6-phosphate isomerase-like protein (cupin superfamily)